MKFSRPSLTIAVFAIFFLLIEGIPVHEKEQVVNATDFTQDANGTSRELSTGAIAFIIIGGGVCGALVAPSAVSLMVASLGFKTGGIALGSVGASLMSYTAPVASGGMVATFQSIGAAGLGTGGTSASMAAGAVIGSSAAAGGIIEWYRENVEPSTSKFIQWYKGKVEPPASKFIQDTNEWYKEKVEPPASEFVQNANEWYKEKVEPSVSKFIQDTNEWYKEKVEPSTSEFAQGVNEWYKEKVEPSASEFVQGASEWYKENIKNSASGFVNGWYKQIIISPSEDDL